MCGIVGDIGDREAVPVILEGFRRLEYRGYDSAGAAILSAKGIETRRSVGKIARLEEVLARRPLPGKVGLGHTRWATHGRPSGENAHPHRAGPFVVVHNGIIENHLAPKMKLEAGVSCQLSAVSLVHARLKADGRWLKAPREAIAP